MGADVATICAGHPALVNRQHMAFLIGAAVWITGVDGWAVGQESMGVGEAAVIL